MGDTVVASVDGFLLGNGVFFDLDGLIVDGKVEGTVEGLVEGGLEGENDGIKVGRAKGTVLGATVEGLVAGGRVLVEVDGLIVDACLD